MKVFFSVLLLSAIFLQACRTLTSQTFIEPGQSFVLGEGTHGAFRAKVKNTGTSAVEIARESLEGNKTKVAILAPGDETRVNIGAVCPEFSTFRQRNFACYELFPAI
jgi:hypothetical protein